MKKRHKILIFVILILFSVLIFLEFNPIGNGNWNAEQIAKIESSKTSNDFCFAVMGDNHDGYNIFNRIISNVDEKNPLFAIDVGDLVQNGDKEEYRRFYNTIQNFDMPFFTVVGNHDIRFLGRINYLNTFGNYYYSFSYNSSIFIILDDSNQKNIDDIQLRFLEDELKKNYKNKFIFMHVPAEKPQQFNISLKIIDVDTIAGPLTDEKSINEFKKIVHKYNVTAVFNGHLHGYFNDSINGTQFITTGGAGGLLFPSDPSHYFYNYVYACVNNSKFSYQVIPFASPKIRINHISFVIFYFIYYSISSNRYLIAFIIFVLVFIWSVFNIHIKSFFKKRFKKSKSEQH